ncbi:hypothetical protein Hanom_Chr12g01173881 [Helianthus anomalus]
MTSLHREDNIKVCIFSLIHAKRYSLGRGGSLVIEIITHKHQSSSDISSIIFPSLTTFFSGGGHHSSPHPTIFPQPTIPLTKINHHALYK